MQAATTTSKYSETARGWLVLASVNQPPFGGSSIGVETVTVGSLFVRRLRETKPRLAVLSLPPAEPPDLLAAAAERSMRPGLRLMFLNELADVAGRLEALAMGFDEALPASTDPVELAGRAHLLLEGSARLENEAVEPLLIGNEVRLDLVGRRVERRGRDIHLRPKEFALLSLLASEPGRVFSRDELVDRIWGHAYEGGRRTVDVHIRWLRAKIERDPARPVHLITVRGIGYRLDPPGH